MKSVGMQFGRKFGLPATLLVLVATGCGKGEAPNSASVVPASVSGNEYGSSDPVEVLEVSDLDEVASLEEVENAPTKLNKPAKPWAPQKPAKTAASLGVPAWGNSAERRRWGNAVLTVVRARIRDLEKARDKEIFCPGYANASALQRQNCWLLVVAAIAKFESAFNPSSSFREPDGNYSIGMMAMSPGECPNAPDHDDLQVAVPNLVCGTNRMASLIARDGYIDGPHPRRGAARYWSTLRAPYRRWDESRDRYLNLGKRNLILPLVRGYRGKAASQRRTPAANMMASWEEQAARYIAEMPVQLDTHGYHNE